MHILEQYIENLSKEFSFQLSYSEREQKSIHVEIGKEKISLKDLAPGILCRSLIAPLPKQNREEFLLLALRANFLGQGTGGATIGLLEDESFLTLSSMTSHEISYETFKEMVEDFINFLSYWKEQVALQEKG